MIDDHNVSDGKTKKLRFNFPFLGVEVLCCQTNKYKHVSRR